MDRNYSTMATHTVVETGSFQGIEELNGTNETKANYSHDIPDDQDFAKSDIYTWFFSSTILCVLSTIANTFSILAIKNIPGKLTGNHILYLNLSIADILGSLASNIELVTLAFFELWFHLFDDKSAFMGLVYFRIIGFACFILFYSVSAWTLLGFAILRYVAICRSMYYPNIYQRRKILIGIAIIWSLALAVSVPTLCLLKLGDPTEDQFCTIVHYIWPAVFAFISLVIIILYVCVYFESKRAMVRANRMHPGQEYPNHQYKAFVTTLLLLATLALSFLPYIIIRILRLSDRGLKLKSAYFNFIYFLPYINFGSDPVIYASRTRDIREGYSRLWRKITKCCKRCSHRETKFERASLSTMEVSCYGVRKIAGFEAQRWQYKDLYKCRPYNGEDSWKKYLSNDTCRGHEMLTFSNERHPNVPNAPKHV